MSMAHVNIEELWWHEVQLSRQQLRTNYRKIRVRLPCSTQSKARAASVVSIPNGILLLVALVILCLLRSANGSSTPCTVFARISAEHTIRAGGWKLYCHQVDRAPENYHRCRSGDESCWSCVYLNKPKPRQPFFLQSTSGHARAQASAGDMALGKSSCLGKCQGRFADQFTTRKLGPIDDNKADEWWKKAGPRLREQHCNVVRTETVCSRDSTTSLMSSSESFSRLVLAHKKLRFEGVSLRWRCNSTVVAQMTTQSGTAASSLTRDSTSLPTASAELFVNLGTTTLTLNTMTEKRKRNQWVIQILEAVDSQLTTTKGNDDGPQPVAAIVVDGRRMMGRRRVLLSGSWKPVIVIDSVIVGIGFFLTVSALSCWLWQRRAVKSDSSSEQPSTGSDPSPIRGASLGRGSSFPDEGSGRWKQAADGGPGRWELIEEDALGPGSQVPPVRGQGIAGVRGQDRSQRVAEGGPVVGPQVEREDPDRSPPVQEGGPVAGPSVGKEGSGRGSRMADGGFSAGPHVEEEDQSKGPRVVEEGPGTGSGAAKEYPGRRSGVIDGGSIIVTPPQDDGARTTTTAHRSWQAIRYRAEPFCFKGLSAATEGFDERNKLGAGSFGTVYRGLLFDGRVAAIKRADRTNTQRTMDKESAFKAELDVMSRLHHKHLVNLMGYCDDCGEMVLVYEYMPNGSLSDHLHNKVYKSRALSTWKARIRVALQAARGIEYLHTYAEPPVIHRDIKSSNILLDAKGSVRVSDFGLCLIFPSSSEDEEDEVQHITTKAAGTMGYMDPEYYHHRYLTTKSDVYSFGVVILELLTGKTAIHRLNKSHVSVVDYAVPAIEADELARVADPRVRVPTGHEFVAMKVMAEIGSQAVRLRGKDRPSMTEIVRRLEQAVILCRSRHVPLPVFGAQIGSSTDLSASPPCCLYVEPTFRYDHGNLFDEFVGGGEEEKEEDEDEDEDEGPPGTNVAQVGSLSSSQAHILEDFFQDIHHNGAYDDQLEHYHSDVDLQFYYDSLDSQNELLRCRWPAGAPGSAAGSSIAKDHQSYSSAPTATTYFGGGQASIPHSSSRWRWTPEHQEMQLQDLRVERRQQTHGPSDTGKIGKSGVLGLQTLPRGASRYSGHGGSASQSTIEVGFDYYSSGMVVDDPLMDQRTAIMAGFSNFSDLGPPEDINPPPPRPPPPSQGQQVHQLLAGRASGQEVGYYVGPSCGTGSAAEKKDQGQEFEGSAENYISNVDIQEFLDEYTDELAGSTSYTGLSNFSVLHDLDELMKALHSLQEQQKQEELEKLQKEQGSRSIRA